MRPQLVKNSAGENPMDDTHPLYTYNFICMKDRSTMNLEISKKLDYLPKCLKCDQSMTLRYSINDDGDIWMNSAIMHD